MEPDKPPANVLSRKWSRCPPHIVVSSRSARRVIWDGSVEKSCVPVRSSSRHIRINFWARMPGPGNGDYRGELLRTLQVITSYATKRALPLAQVLLRLDGLYGDAAPLIDVLTIGLGVIARSRDYRLLDLEVVTQALTRVPDQVSIHPESGMTRALYDCPAVSLTPTGPSVRLVVATHPATSSPPKIGVERDETVYELFVSTLPSPAFTPSDVLDLYLHRGSFETVLAYPLPVHRDARCPAQGSERLYALVVGRETSLRCVLSISYTQRRLLYRIRIGGTPICPAARSFAKFSRSGFGTCAWNWGRSSPRPICAPRNLPKPWESRLLRENLSRSILLR